MRGCSSDVLRNNFNPISKISLSDADPLFHFSYHPVQTPVHTHSYGHQDFFWAKARLLNTAALASRASKSGSVNRSSCRGMLLPFTKDRRRVQLTENRRGDFPACLFSLRSKTPMPPRPECRFMTVMVLHDSRAWCR